MQTIRIVLVSIVLLVGLTAHSAPAQENITIWVDGVRLAGSLWKPDGIRADEKRPALLMVHGWGGTKSHLDQAYAPRFAALGYIVLTFDYRGWGDSDGKLIRVGDKPEDTQAEFMLKVKEVRTIVDPLDQLEDIRAAHAFLVGDSQVDSNRLAIWGSSLGGGLALQSAATLPGFQVLITQVGSINPRAADVDDPEAPLSPTNMQNLRSAVSRGDRSPFPGPEAEMPGLKGYPDWHRYVRYDPFATVDRLNAATLIIDARDEELFDIEQNGAALYAAIKDRLKAKYKALPGKHYDVYRGDGYIEAVAMQAAWLKEYLPLK